MAVHARVINEKSVYRGLEGELVDTREVGDLKVVDLRFTAEGSKNELIETFIADEVEPFDISGWWPVVALVVVWALCALALRAVL